MIIIMFIIEFKEKDDMRKFVWDVTKEVLLALASIGICMLNFASEAKHNTTLDIRYC
jgi:hypothetical protein